MKGKIILVAAAASIVLLIAIIGVSLYNRDPSFSDEPVPIIGNEIRTISTEANIQLQHLFDESGVPSMAVGILAGEELVWAKGYGEQPDLSTVYMIGSIDKTMIATSILQLAEQEQLALDDDINEYLPFPVRHPDYPEAPITIRMLLSHISGLPHDVSGTGFASGPDALMVRWELENSKDFTALVRYLIPPSDKKLEEIFSLESGAKPDFWLSKPGSSYHYSNTAFLLLSNMIIEAVSGQSHEDYIRENIFNPLGMENTSYQAEDFPRGQIAAAYEDFGRSGASALPITGLTATGKIRSNIIDLSRFLLVHMNEGSSEGMHILQPGSIAEMHDQQKALNFQDFPPMNLEGVGLGWFLWEDGYQGHGGAVPGYFAQLYINEGEDVPYGAVILTTYGCSKTPCDKEWFDTYFVRMRDILFEEGIAAALM